MSYNDRINAAQEAIRQHNEAIFESLDDKRKESVPKLGHIDSNKFILNIKLCGGTSEDRLSDLSYEDILECLPDGGMIDSKIKPRILAKEIAKIFRKKDTEETSKNLVSNKKAEKLTLRELIEAFDPEEVTNAIGLRLAAIAKNAKFIVYLNGRNVDVDSTFKLISEIKSGYPGRDDIIVNGDIKKVYALGELPENFAEENPLYRNRPLRPDGTCDQTGRSWEGVDMQLRQFVRLAMTMNELNVTHEVAHNILDILMGDNPKEKLQQRYRKTAIAFDQLLKMSNLPVLKIVLNKQSTDALGSGKQVVWGISGKGNSYTTNIGPQ